MSASVKNGTRTWNSVVPLNHQIQKTHKIPEGLKSKIKGFTDGTGNWAIVENGSKVRTSALIKEFYDTRFAKDQGRVTLGKAAGFKLGNKDFYTVVGTRKIYYTPEVTAKLIHKPISSDFNDRIALILTDAGAVYYMESVNKHDKNDVLETKLVIPYKPSNIRNTVLSYIFKLFQALLDSNVRETKEKSVYKAMYDLWSIFLDIPDSETLTASMEKVYEMSSSKIFHTTLAILPTDKVAVKKPRNVAKTTSPIIISPIARKMVTDLLSKKNLSMGDLRNYNDAELEAFLKKARLLKHERSEYTRWLKS